MEDFIINTTINGINAKRCRIFKLSTFDCLTQKERALYNSYSRCSKKEEKKVLRNLFIEKLNEFPEEARIVSDDNIFKKYNNEITNELREDKQIVLFESEMIRFSDDFSDDTEDVSFIKDIVFLEVYQMEILHQILEYGLMINNEKYIFYSSSTSQMKNNEITLLRENFYTENEYKIMCGLTDDIINARSGINMGKHLAYNSLSLSQSVPMETEINIDDIIVVDDFETEITAKVNYIDVESLEISEQEMSIPVQHMDGGGIALPGVFPGSVQLRGGCWIKGCCFPFDFHKFIDEKEAEGKEILQHIIDPWGEKISIETIKKAKVILTKSQFKMWDYYGSWEEYKAAFKKVELIICINNMVHEPKSKQEIHIAYQVLQTIPRENMTDTAIERLSQRSVNYINGAKTDSKIALKMMGVDVNDPEVLELNPFKAAIKVCPDLLKDNYVKRKMHSAILAERKKAMGGKLLVEGIWAYICPDLYAFCEWLFLGDKNPKGLIPADKVYNSYYNGLEDVEEVCCVRYPHLSDCEHGIRQLVKNEECDKWFYGFDTVISIHDLLIKTLQADVDGDKMAAISDRSFINLVDRNKLPLYYVMKKADKEEISVENIYKCLNSSFHNEGIGDVSNAITKELNCDEPDYDLIRILTAYNNYCIDFPKTQYSLDLKQYSERYDKLKNKDCLPPYFFKYAKDKKTQNCLKCNKKSNVDRISKYIEKETRDGITLDAWDKNKDQKFNPVLLTNQSDKSMKINRNSKEYIELQVLLNRLHLAERGMGKNDYILKKRMESHKDLNTKKLRENFFYYLCNKDFFKVISDRDKVAGYILDIEYFQEENANESRDIVWNCFGDILYKNLCENQKIPEGKFKVRRLAYQSRDKRNKKIEQEMEKLQEEINNSKKVQIMQSELDWIFGIKTRKDCSSDKYLLYILYVLYKRSRTIKLTGEVRDKDYIFISKNKRNEYSITRNTIDGWIGSKISGKGLIRLEKREIIRLEELKKYDKIYFNIPSSVKEDSNTDSCLFDMGIGNPLIYLYSYNNERVIKQCEICRKDFIVIGNSKTCGEICSRKLELRNKNKAV